MKTALGKESGGTARLHEKFGYAYDAAGNLQYRTNNALIQTFAVDNLNQLSSISRSGTITVAGNSSAAASSVSVNGASATLYADNAFAKESLTLTNGANSFTAIGTDASSRSGTNTAAGNYPTTASCIYDANGNLLTDANLGYDYDDENQLVRVRRKGGLSEFVYDGRNRRRTNREYGYTANTTAISTVQFPWSTASGFSGWHGLRFTVGNNPIYASELGRYRLSSSTATHTVKLTTDTGIDLPGGAVTANLSAGSGFVFAELAAPVYLAANTTYYLVSSSTASDPYYDCQYMNLTNSSDITIGGGVETSRGGYIATSYCNGAHGHGPVSFKYKLIGGSVETDHLYDGNVMVQERNADNLPLTTYTRGLDLSGSLQGAGGIGGLLARTDHTALNGRTDYYHQDGNGNVTYLANQNQGLAAKYTYDPYGRVLAKSGPMVEANRMQFSGKESDAASGLSYYGRRFYHSVLQRWLNQDPLRLEGGHNLFAFVLNDPADRLDALGLIWSWERSGEARATVVSNDPRDTFADLAQMLRLDVSDYRNWLLTRDSKPGQGKKYSVPNTVHIDYGFGSSGSIFGATIFDLWRALLETDIQDFRSRGFLVVETESANKETILGHLQSKDVYGYWFVGHGSGDGIINASDRRPNEGLLAERYTSFGIAFMNLFACNSATAATRPSRARFKYTAWEANVFTWGFFTGYTGSPGLCNPDGLVVTHGINGNPIDFKKREAEATRNSPSPGRVIPSRP